MLRNTMSRFVRHIHIFEAWNLNLEDMLRNDFFTNRQYGQYLLRQHWRRSGYWVTPAGGNTPMAATMISKGPIQRRPLWILKENGSQ